MRKSASSPSASPPLFLHTVCDQKTGQWEGLGTRLGYGIVVETLLQFEDIIVKLDQLSPS